MAASVEFLRDPCSVANLNTFVVEHTALRFCAHIESKRLFGSVDLRIKRVDLVGPAGGAVEGEDAAVLLDIHLLKIHSSHLVESTGAIKALPFTITPFASYGSTLSVSGLTSKTGDVFTLRFFVETNEATPCLSWLSPEQTADKVHPFVFSQGQAVLNRSMFPCQDSPGRRTTWAASLLVPKPLYAVFSAGMEVDQERNVPLTTDDITAEDALALYPPSLGLTSAAFTEDSSSEAFGGLPRIPLTAFRKVTAAMPQPVAAYLVAFAIGDLRCKQIGHRVRVWSEKSLLEKAAWEFGHNDSTERYLAALENIYGGYQWTDYSIVVMVPSFPYGGMENPRATFVTPALITGDQSLTDVVAHEIAHSWSGNLVACPHWGAFWINEGFTMYLQRRACTIVDGEAITALETAAGRELLRATVFDYGLSSPLMRLTVECGNGVDPDELYSDQAYEGGFAFLSYLKACVGSIEKFDAWLKDYFTSFSFKTAHVVDVLDSFFKSFPEFKGSWTREGWLKDEKDESAQWNAVVQAPPADLEAIAESSLPPMPPVNPATCCVDITDEKGRTGLAYRKGFEFMRWLHASGFPCFYPSCKAGESLSKPAEDLAAAWVSKAKDKESAAVAKPEGADAFPSWPTLQKCTFLDALLLSAENEIGSVCPPRATPEQVATAASTLGNVLQPWNRLVAALDTTYGFGSSPNAEIRLRFSRLIGITVSQSHYGSVVDYLKSTGKLKYVTPTFRALCGGSPAPGHESVKLQERPGWKLALETYRAIRPTLHPVVQSRLEGVFDGYKDVTGEAMVW